MNEWIRLMMRNKTEVNNRFETKSYMDKSIQLEQCYVTHRDTYYSSPPTQPSENEV